MIVIEVSRVGCTAYGLGFACGQSFISEFLAAGGDAATVAAVLDAFLGEDDAPEELVDRFGKTWRLVDFGEGDEEDWPIRRVVYRPASPKADGQEHPRP